MSREIPNQSDKVKPAYGDFLWWLDSAEESMSGWVVTGCTIKVAFDDYGIVLKRVNVDTGAKEVAFFYAGSLKGCVAKWKEALLRDGIKWVKDRF